MKKLLFLLFIPLVYSCTTTQYKAFERVSYIDYSSLTERGLFVTESNSVNFNYIPLGSVYVEIREGEVKTSNSKKIKRTDDYLYGNQSNNTHYVAANINQALDLLYSQAQKVGANGIINLKIVNLTPTLYMGNQFYGPGFAISGMAIKE